MIKAKRVVLWVGVFLLSLFASSPVSAAAGGCSVRVLTDDTSSSANARAPIARYQYARGVYLIRASEIATSGLVPGPIFGIGWTYNAAPQISGTAPLKIYLQNSSDTTNTKPSSFSSAISGMTRVHDESTTLPATAGTFQVDFHGGSTFNYTGGAVYVAFDWGAYTGPLGAGFIETNIALTGGFLGVQSSGGTVDALNVSNFRPETYLAADVPGTEVSIFYVIAKGEVPLGLVGDQHIQATVFNNGSEVVTDIPVTLTITGAQPSTQTVNVASLGACRSGGALITFDDFTPALIGENTLTVSVPADAVPANDSLARRLDVTPNRMSFEHAGVPATGGFGFLGSGGAFVARFDTEATQVDAISVNFFAPTSIQYKLEIRADDGAGHPGALLYQDSANRIVTVAGTQTIRLPAPVPVSGPFFAGIRQANAVHPQYGINSEIPGRAGTFFYHSGGASAWVDFASESYNLQLNVGVTVGNCLQFLSVDVTPNTAQACVNGNITMTASASGSPPYTYQWTEHGADIPGATGSTYLATNNSTGTHTFNCRVTDSGACSPTLDAETTSVTWVAPAVPAEIAAGPEQSNQLGWTTKQDLVWPVSPDAATYTLYRGIGNDLPTLLDASIDSCTRYQGADPQASGLSETPSPAAFYWYVVTGSSVCALEGPAGSSRVVNSAGACP